MNQHRATDLARSYRANDIQAANDRRRARATASVEPIKADAEIEAVARPSRLALTIRRYLPRHA